MNRTIRCRINGHVVEIEARRRKLPVDPGTWSEDSHRRVETKPGNVWPWRFMERRECVTIPYALANYCQIQNAINGYTKNSCGAKFSYRSEALGLSVWCLKTRERKKK